MAGARIQPWSAEGAHASGRHAAHPRCCTGTGFQTRTHRQLWRKGPLLPPRRLPAPEPAAAGRPRPPATRRAPSPSRRSRASTAFCRRWRYWRAATGRWRCWTSRACRCGRGSARLRHQAVLRIKRPSNKTCGVCAHAGLALTAVQGQTLGCCFTPPHLTLPQLALRIPDAHARAVHAVVQPCSSAFALGGGEARAALELFATAAADGTAKLWDLRAGGRCVRCLAGGHKSAQVGGVALQG